MHFIFNGLTTISNEKKPDERREDSLIAGSSCTNDGSSQWDVLLCVCSGLTGARKESLPPLGVGKHLVICPLIEVKPCQ